VVNSAKRSTLLVTPEHIMGTDGGGMLCNCNSANHVPSNPASKRGNKTFRLLVFGDFSQLLINQWSWIYQ
jgi:hypothetical protein